MRHHSGCPVEIVKSRPALATAGFDPTAPPRADPSGRGPTTRRYLRRGAANGTRIDLAHERPRALLYSLEVGSRGDIQYSTEDLQTPGAVSLSLGDY